MFDFDNDDMAISALVDSLFYQDRTREEEHTKQCELVNFGTSSCSVHKKE